MTSPPIGTDQELIEDELEIIAALRGWAKNLRSGQDQAWLEDAADALQSRISEVERLREALNAIIDRAPERDVKWAGMTAKDIAVFALSQHRTRDE